MENKPTLSLVTGTLDRPESFQRLLSSIEKHTSVPWELVVADASEVPYVPILPNVHVLHECPRLGFTKGYNLAFKHCLGKWVIWLNDDAEVMPGYAETAIAFMESHARIGLGALPYADGDSSFFRVNTYMRLPYANFGIISRELGNQVGWFDEDFPMYGSDNSLTFRVLMAGKGVSAISGQFIRHHAMQDDHRKRNQASRISEAKKLQDKYRPYHSGMVSNYQAALR